MHKEMFKEIINRLKDFKMLSDLENISYKELSQPDKVLTVNFPIELKNGEIKNFTGYRCQFDDILGPYKGGVRYHPNVNKEEVEDLASLMTWKTALMNLPLGGSKGGVNCNPRKLHREDLENITRKYTREIRDIIGPKKDIPAPDVNTDSKTMAHMMDEYSNLKGYSVPGVVTGKPLSIGGIEGRKEATGYGLSIAFKLFMNYLDYELKDVDVAIQGFGNVGKIGSQFIKNLGSNIVGISDSSTALYDKKGLNISELSKFKEKNQLDKYTEAKKVSNNELLKLDVDVLIPAALEDAVDEEIARNLKANSIIEAANGPITTGADKILRKNNIPVLPDIFSNSGGVIASYLEWTQNLQRYSWGPEKVKEEIKNRMSIIFDKIIKKIKSEETSYLRDSCYLLSLKQLLKAYKYRKNL